MHISSKCGKDVKVQTLPDNTEFADRFEAKVKQCTAACADASCKKECRKIKSPDTPLGYSVVRRSSSASISWWKDAKYDCDGHDGASAMSPRARPSSPASTASMAAP